MDPKDFDFAVDLISRSRIFDQSYYCDMASIEIENRNDAVVHYLTIGSKSNLSPNLFFDVDFYREAHSSYIGDDDPLFHYIKIGEKLRLSTFLYFDPIYYRNRYSVQNDCNILEHYLEFGLSQGRSPHPMIDGDWYSEMNEDVVIAGVNPILHWLNDGRFEGRAPNWFFDVKYYKDKLGWDLASFDWVGHYMREGWRAGKNPHALFAGDYYISIIKNMRSGQDPLSHFLSSSQDEGVSPCPAFDQKYYIDQVESIFSIPALRHYLEGTGTIANPHPLFDSKYYVSRYPDVIDVGINPLVHYFTYGYWENRIPHPLFDTAFYRNEYMNGDYEAGSPLSHYLTNRGKFTKKNAISLKNLMSWGAFSACTKLTDSSHPLNDGAIYKKNKLIFFCHEASRTGAPLIILRLVEHFAAEEKWDLITLMDQGGPLSSDFQRVSHVIDMDIVRRHTGYGEEAFDRVLDIMEPSSIEWGLCNTANSLACAKALRRSGIRSISLVHEFPDFYGITYFKELYEFNERIIYPSQFTRAQAIRMDPRWRELSPVLPQGLLDPNFADGDGIVARCWLRNKLGTGGEAFIVLGCGTAGGRKGTDLFFDVARRVLRSCPEEDIHFVWLGDKNHIQTWYEWWEYDAKRLGSGSVRFHAIDALAAPAQVFLGSDVFFLSSRADPFPCVTHEAMACSLPIIAFDGSGGAPEALQNGAGIVVPYADVDSAAEAIVSLYRSPDAAKILGKSALERVHSEYQFRDYYLSITRLIEECGGPQAPKIESSIHSPKVYFISPDWGISGVNSLNSMLIRGLRSAGIDAAFLFSRPVKGEEALMLPPDLPITVLETEGYTLEARRAAVKGFLVNQGHCIVVPNYDYLSSSLAPELPDEIAVVGVVHSDDIEHYEHVAKLGSYWSRIVAVSNRVATVVKESHPSFSEKIILIPNGIERSEKIPAREYYKSGPINIVYTGRIVQHQKRILDIIPLVEGLTEGGVNFILTIVGEGPELEAIRQRLLPHIEVGRVVLTGRISTAAVIKILDLSDVFLLLSSFEGLPISLLEAMARGCVPVVTRIASGVSELVEDNVSGLTFSVGDIRGLLRHIEVLARDRVLMERLSLSAATRVATGRYSVEEMVDSYAELFRAVWGELHEEEKVTRTRSRRKATAGPKKTPSRDTKLNPDCQKVLVPLM